MTKGGKVNARDLRGRDHQHPLHAVRRGLSRRPEVGGLDRRPGRAAAAAPTPTWRCWPPGWPRRPGSTSWPRTPAIRSNTSVCLKVVDPARHRPCRPTPRPTSPRSWPALLEKEGVALDIGGYRDAPPGLRIWCGATVETDDLDALTPWLDWAFATARRRAARRPKPRSLAPSGEGVAAVGRSRSPPPLRVRTPPGRLRGPPSPQGEGALKETPHAPRVLIADQLSPAAVEIFKAARRRGRRQDRPHQGRAARRSSATTTAWPSARPPRPTRTCSPPPRRLKVIGRAGIGVDNVDIPAATAAGVVVMNTPFGNSITTAEHAIAMMFALARQLPAGRRSPPRPASGRRTASWAWSSTPRPWA